MDTPTSAPANQFCGACGAPLIANAAFCPACGQRVALPGAPAAAAAPMPPPQAAPVQPPNAATFAQQGLHCPRCGSTQVQAAKRGWKWTTGMIGSGKMTATCLQCGSKFDLN